MADVDYITIPGYNLFLREALQLHDADRLHDILLSVTDMHVKAEVLTYAVQTGKHWAVEILLEHDADPYLKHDGRNALYWAVKTRSPDTLKCLLQLPFDQLDAAAGLALAARGVEASVIHKEMRFHHKRKRAVNEAVFDAACHGLSECLEELWDAGADPNNYFYHDDEYMSWSTPLIAACYCPHFDMVDDDTIYNVVESLVEHGADVCKTNHMSDSSLHWAAASCLVRATQLLIRNGADIHHKNSLGRTVLMTFFESHKVQPAWKLQQILKLLLCSGVAVEEEDVDCWTALCYAVSNKNGHIETLKWFLEQGVLPDKSPYTTCPNVTPLFLAVTHMAHEITKLLVNFGADINVRVKSVEASCSYASPMQAALQNHDILMVQILQVSGAIEYISSDSLAELEAEIEDDDMKSVFEDIQNTCQSCSTLVQLCRNSIRNVVRWPELQMLSPKYIPNQLVHYLKFVEFDTM